jgi:pentatricopeptide repeat protein
MANTVLLRLLEMLLLCRAASSFCLSFSANQHALVAAHRLVKASSAPDHPGHGKRSDRRQPLKRSSSSSSNTARRTADRDAVQKSKALTARIGELGRQRRWQDVLRAVETAESSGQKLDVFNYSAAIAALARCQQPERALQLLPRMRQQGIAPSVVVYNALISACSKSCQLQRANELFGEMQKLGINSNVFTYTAYRCLQQERAVAKGIRAFE